MKGFSTSNDRLQILIATYQIERQAQASRGPIQAALTGTSLAYMIAATVFIAGNPNARELPHYLLLSIPLPSVAIMGLIAVLMETSNLRNHYLLHLEYLLSANSSGTLDTFPRFIALNQRSSRFRFLLYQIIGLSYSFVTVVFTVFFLDNVERIAFPLNFAVVVSFKVLYGILLGSAFLIVGLTDRKQRLFDIWAEKELRRHDMGWYRRR